MLLQSKKLIQIIALLVTSTLVLVALYRWLRFDMIDGGTIFFSFLALSYFFNTLTWGNPEGAEAKDEREEHIILKSTKVGYFVLMIGSALILFISEGVTNLNDIDNYPLLLVVCLTFVTLPITEFIYAKKYR
jgi:hypothetical protein